MSSLDLRLIPREYWVRAADHLTQHTPSDLLPDFELDVKRRHCLIDRILDDDLFFSCDFRALQVLVPRANRAFRSAHLLSPDLDLCSVAGAMYVLDRVDGHRFSKEEKVTFSYRLDETKKSWFDPSVGWSQYQARSVNRAQSFRQVATADVSGFYSSIKPKHLNKAQIRCGLNQEENAVLDWLIESLVHEDWGLMVGGDAARMMAELVMIPIDNEMRRTGLEFIRFVDDFRFFAETEVVIDEVLYNATSILTSHGFQWNKSKLNVLNSEEFLQREQFKSTIRISDGNSGIDVLNDHFDPYAELVNHKVIELRKEMGGISLSGALARELEKIRPSIPNMKVLLAGIPLAKSDEKEACLAILSEMFITDWAVEILPHVYRMFRKLDWLHDLASRKAICTGLESALFSSRYRTPYEKAFLINCHRRVSVDRFTSRLTELLSKIRLESADEFLLREVVYSLEVSKHMHVADD